MFEKNKFAHFDNDLRNYIDILICRKNHFFRVILKVFFNINSGQIASRNLPVETFLPN